MKKLLLACLFISTLSNAQHTIKGTLEPVEKYPWMLLYKLRGAKQDFIAYDTIKQGTFEINIPSGSSSGIYRLIYDQKNRLFVDVIYDQEDIEFRFHPKRPNQTIEFTKSKNNQHYFDYLRTISKPQQTLDSMQVDYFKPDANGAIAYVYKKKYNDILNIQDHFENMTRGTLAYHFIKASARYNPVQPVKQPAEYLKEIQNHFFDHIDFDSKELDHSTFKQDKITDFIFYLNRADDAETMAELRKEAIDHVFKIIQSNRELLKDIQETLLYNLAKQEDVVLTNHIINHYLQLPKELQDASFINDIMGQLRTAVGAIAPNINWEENGVQMTLHQLYGDTNYLVVFWSSGCSHCLQELPLLKDYLKDKPHIRVLAIGLEDELSTPNWQKEISKYPKWTHIYGKDKWKNKHAISYGVDATPSFYVLDPQKKVLAKPDSVEDLRTYLDAR